MWNPGDAKGNQFFLGVDIGATKSHALIANETGVVIGFGTGGPGNYEVVGYEGLAGTLQEITRKALESAGLAVEQISGAGFGIAGYDWPVERLPILEQVQTLGLRAPLEIVNDAIISLLAGAPEGWGVAVVAGTSNNCWGWDEERREGRVTGNASMMGEYGGASELVMKAIHAVAAEWTRRGPPTLLTRAFIEFVGAADVERLLEGLSIGRYKLTAGVAPLVFQVAADGDSVARDLIVWTGRELGSLAIGVIRQLGFEKRVFDVVMGGSLFNGSPVIADTMGETIRGVAPGARLVRLQVPPVVGGVLLGVEQSGRDSRLVRERLLLSAREVLMARVNPHRKDSL